MRPRLAALLPALALLLFVAGLCLRPMEETDLFFRLAVGEQILRAGAVPQRNLFSFTYPDHPDLDSAWLFDVGAAGLQRAGGFPAVVLAKTLLVLLVFAFAYRLCRARGAAALAAVAALTGAAVVMAERLVERPHLFSFAGELAVLAALATTSRRRWLLVPAAALWANLHAGVFVAPLLLLAGAAGALLDARRPGAEGGARASLPVLGLAGASALAALLTPVGTGLLRYLAFHLHIAALHPIDEFRRPSWRWDAPLLVYGAAVAIALLATRARPARWRDVLPLLVLGALTARSVRFAADFALVAAPLLAERLAVLGDRWSRLGAVVAGPRAVMVAVAGLVLAAAAPRVAAVRAGGPLLELGLGRDVVPLGAIRFVEEHGLRGRMYNDLEVGGYLAWKGYPRERVFVDPRLPAYPREFHALLGRGDLGRAEWDAALAGHGVDSALLAYAGVNRRVAWWDPARWALVYRQEDARVFVRRLDRWRALIAAQEIPATFSFTEAEGTRTLPLEQPPPGSPVPRCEWDLRLADLYFELDGDDARALSTTRRALSPPGCLSPARTAGAAAWAGAALLGRRDPEGALAALDQALALRPGDPATLTNRALALEALGRGEEARAAWVRVAAASPGTPLADRARARAGQARPP
jgi:hypothetical protein